MFRRLFHLVFCQTISVNPATRIFDGSRGPKALTLESGQPGGTCHRSKTLLGWRFQKKMGTPHHRIFHCKQPSILKVGTPILRTSMMFPSILGQTTIDKQVSRDHVKCVFVLSNCLLQHVLVAHNLRNGYSKSGLNLQSAIYVQLILPGFKDILSFCRLAVSRKHMEIRY